MSDVVELPELDGDGRGSFVYESVSYAVFTVDGAIVVTDGACPHKGGPIAEGIIRDGAVVCPWHWYTFDLRTGHCRTAELGDLRRHEVVLIDGVPHARLAPRPVRSWSAVLRELAQTPASGEPPGSPIEKP